MKIIAGLIVVISIIVLINYPESVYGSIAFLTIFSLGGLVLSLETIKLFKSGEVKATVYLSAKEETILQTDSPYRFYFFVLTYSLLAVFCFFAVGYELFGIVSGY